MYVLFASPYSIILTVIVDAQNTLFSVRFIKFRETESEVGRLYSLNGRGVGVISLCQAKSNEITLSTVIALQETTIVVMMI